MPTRENITNLSDKIVLGIRNSGSIFLDASSDESVSTILRIGNSERNFLSIAAGTISGLGNPTGASDAVNKAYVDNMNTALSNLINGKDNYQKWVLKSHDISSNIVSQAVVTVNGNGDVVVNASGGSAPTLTIAHKTDGYASGSVGGSIPTTGDPIPFGGTFEVPYITASNGHVTLLAGRNIKLPTQTVLSLAGTGTGLSVSGGSANITQGLSAINVISGFSVSNHTITLQTSQVSFPATDISVVGGANITSLSSRTLTTIGNITSSGRTLTITKSTVTIPETELSVAANAQAETQLQHGDTVTLVTGVKKVSGSSHELEVTTVPYKIPEYNIDVDGSPLSAQTPAHGGSFNIVSGLTAEGHTLTPTTSTVTLPAETPVSASVEAEAGTNSTLGFGDTFEAVTGVNASGHTVTLSKTVFTLPPEPAKVQIPNITVTSPAAVAEDVAEDGTFTALSGLSASNHALTVSSKKFKINLDSTPSTGTAKTLSVGGAAVSVQTNTDVSGINVNPEISNLSIAALPGGSGSVSAAQTNQTTFNVITGVSLAGNGALTVNTGTLTVQHPTFTDHDEKVTQITVSDATAHQILIAKNPGGIDGVYAASGITATGSGNLIAARINATTALTAKDVTVTGNFTVQGNSTIIDAENLSTKDYTIELASGRGATTPLAGPAGLFAKNYDGTATSGGLIFDSTGTARVGDLVINATTGMIDDESGAQAIMTRAEEAQMTNGQVVIWDGTTKSAKTSGYTIAKSVPSNAVFTDTLTNVSGGAGLTVTGSGTASVSVAHNVIAIEETPAAATLAHGGTFTAYTAKTNDATGHITGFTKTTYTLPAAQTFSITGSGSVANSTGAKKHGAVINIITSVSASGNKITVGTGNFTLPTLGVAAVSDANTAGNGANVVTGIAIDANGNIAPTIQKLSIPAPNPIPTITAPAGTPASTNAGETVTVVTGITPGGTNGHTLTLSRANITIPDSFDLGDPSVTQSVTANATYAGASTATIEFLTPEVAANGNKYTFKKRTLTLNPHSTSVSLTQANATGTLTHGGHVQVVTGLTKNGAMGINWTLTNFTLPNTTSIEQRLGALEGNASKYVTIAGAQTVTGAKTFSANTTLSSTTTNVSLYGTVSGLTAAKIITLAKVAAGAQIQVGGNQVSLFAGSATAGSTANGVNINASGNIELVSGGDKTTVNNGTVSTKETSSLKKSYHVSETNTTVAAYSIYNESTESIDFCFA